MDWPNECAMVVPCLNEGATIHSLVLESARHLPRIIVVDDGSCDQTAVRASAAGARVIRHEATRGKGYSIQTGLSRAAMEGCRWALLMDGDGQHCPGDIPRFLECAERSRAALVVGNRMGSAAAMPWVRRLANRWMSAWLSLGLGCRLPDSQCGFRLVRLDAWLECECQGDHFEMESEMLLQFVRRGHLIAFVPVKTIYKSERSKIRPLRDGWRWLTWCWRATRLKSRADRLGGKPKSERRRAASPAV